MSLFDLKVIDSVLNQLEDERGIPRESVLEAIEAALATAYKKEYGKRGQIINAHFDPETGEVEFEQAKIVVDPDEVYFPDAGASETQDTQHETSDDDEKSGAETEDDSDEKEDPKTESGDSVRVKEEDNDTDEGEGDEASEKIRFNPEQHILLSDAKKIKKDAEVGEEIIFPLEKQENYGRISAQTAKQVIIQKIREAEKVSVYKEFDNKEGDIVSGTVQRVERGNIYVDLGRATGVLPYEEQIPGEHFKQGQRIRAHLFSVEESSRGIFLRLSRAKPEFLRKLFEMESPEVANGTVEIKAVAREPGSRSKVAVMSHDEYIDPVGSLVGQRGVRVYTVMSELGGEKIDVVEWSDNPALFVEHALSPAEVLRVDIDEDEKRAKVLVAPDQQSLAIGKGGQNARLAAKLTGWKIDIQSAGGDDDDADDSGVSEGEKEVKTDEEAEASESEPTPNQTKDDAEQEPRADEESAEEVSEPAGEETAEEEKDNNGESEEEEDPKTESEDSVRAKDEDEKTS